MLLRMSDLATAVPRPPPLAVLVAVAALGPLASLIFLPSIPGLQREFQTDYATAQLTLTLYVVGLGVAQVLYGPLSDRFGRRPALLAGLALFLAGTLVALFAAGIEALIAGRVVQALGACAGMVLSRAIVRDRYDREHSASVLGYMTGVMVLAPMSAPTIGGFLDVWFGWRSILVFLLAAGVLAAAAVLRFLPETRAEPAAGGGFRALVLGFRLLAAPAFLGYALCVSFTFAVWLAFLGGSPFVVIGLMGLPTERFGPYVLISSSLYMAGNLVAGRISVRVGTDRMIGAGGAITLVGAAALAGLETAAALTPLTLFVAVAVIWFGHAFMVTNGTAAAVSVDPKFAGAAAGIAGSLQMALGAAASYLVGVELADSAAPMIVLMVVGSLLAVACHALVVFRPTPAGARGGAAGD
jgi:DHA1 family bicyclomycin/chloramphenicol resistance-like MFS transporter